MDAWILRRPDGTVLHPLATRACASCKSNIIADLPVPCCTELLRHESPKLCGNVYGNVAGRSDTPSALRRNEHNRAGNVKVDTATNEHSRARSSETAESFLADLTYVRIAPPEQRHASPRKRDELVPFPVTGARLVVEELHLSDVQAETRRRHPYSAAGEEYFVKH